MSAAEAGPEDAVNTVAEVATSIATRTARFKRVFMSILVSYCCLGVYQMGEVQACSCRVAGKSAGGAIPRFTAALVDHRGVLISNTRP